MAELVGCAVLAFEMKNVHGQANSIEEGLVLDMLSKVAVVVEYDVVRTRNMSVYTLDKVLLIVSAY